MPTQTKVESAKKVGHTFRRCGDFEETNLEIIKQLLKIWCNSLVNNDSIILCLIIQYNARDDFGESEF